MAGFLGFVAVISYLLAGIAFLLALAGIAFLLARGDIQPILSALYAICGTVAAAGAAIIGRLDRLNGEPRKPDITETGM